MVLGLVIKCTGVLSFWNWTLWADRVELTKHWNWREESRWADQDILVHLIQLWHFVASTLYIIYVIQPWSLFCLHHWSSLCEIPIQNVAFCEQFPVKLTLPRSMTRHLFDLRRLKKKNKTQNSAAPRATSACHVKLCAWHMCRLLLSLNGRLVQPSERRPAHRLGHQSRWADHSEYIESLNSVKSSLDSTRLQKIPHSCLGLMWV